MLAMIKILKGFEKHECKSRKDRKQKRSKIKL